MLLIPAPDSERTRPVTVPTPSDMTIRTGPASAPSVTCRGVCFGSTLLAFTDLMNRALDRPREQPHEIKITGDDEQIRRLHAGRDRARAAKGQS